MRSVDSKVRELLGDMSINLLAAQNEIEKLTAQRHAAYELLNAHVPTNRIAKIIESNPDFAAYRAARGGTAT